jgi:chromosome segregation ATPase
VSGSDLRDQLVETLRQELGELRQHQAEPLADALLAGPLVAEFIASLDRRCSCDGDPIECNHEAARGQAEAMLSAAQASAKAQLDAKDRTIAHHNEVANTALKAWQAMKDDAEQAETWSYRRWLAWQSARRGRAKAHAELAALLAETKPQLTQTAERLDAIEKVNARANTRAEQAEAERDRLNGEIARLTSEVSDAEAELAQLENLPSELAAKDARIAELEARVERFKKQRAGWSGISDLRAEANEYEAERDRLRATAEQVRALADGARRTGCGAGWNLDPADVRAALDQETP